MRDPHVVSIRYRVKTSPTFEFKNAPAVDHETEAFRLRLGNDELTVEMKEHHATEEEARRAVEDLLEAWELDFWVERGRREAWFEFVDSKIVDRDPPPLPAPGTPRVVNMSTKPAVIGLSTSKATLHVAASRYPTPPTAMVVTPDVATMWKRYEGYLAGREPLTAMAYFCLDLAERLAGTRQLAARTFGISKPVLDKLGWLVSEVGDHATGRKAVAAPRPHTAAETAWIEHTIRRLIRRVAEIAADPALASQQITMTDLPPLPST